MLGSGKSMIPCTQWIPRGRRELIGRVCEEEPDNERGTGAADEGDDGES